MAFYDLLLNCFFLCFTLLVIIFAFKRYRSKYSFWSSIGVSGPTPIPFFGTTLDTYFDSVPNILVKSAKKFGRVYGTFGAFGTTLVVADPKLVKQICVKDFHIFTNRRPCGNSRGLHSKMMSVANDNEWKRLRKIISPTFTTGKIKQMKPLIEACIVNAVEYMEIAAAKKEELNLKQFWSKFTLEVIARCCFATNVNSHKDPENEFLKQVTGFFQRPGLFKMIAIYMLSILPSSVKHRLMHKFFTSGGDHYLANVTLHLMKQRKEEQVNHNDFLQLLIDAHKDNENKSEEPLTETEIIANCILFFIAGYETTANLLSWTSYTLAMNPKVQDKLFDEIKANFTKSDTIDYEVANKLPYLDAIICETLRMYPSLVSIERTASTEFELDGINAKVPANTVVMIPVFAMHRDPELFTEPELFKPDRFLNENRSNIDPYAYLPFGTGPRNCVAMRFALLEVKLAIIHTILNFKIERSNKTPESPKFVKFSSFTSCNNVFVNIKKR